MFPFSIRVARCDDGTHSPAQDGATDKTSVASKAIEAVKQKVTPPESELRRWRRTFETHAKLTGTDGQKYLDIENFVNAIAPPQDLSKITRGQYALLFRVADVNRRGRLSFDDFHVFETLLKRPDADYWIAFQYFDADRSGAIDYDEFKNVFESCLGPEALPFNFDCDWVKLYLGRKDGAHVLGYNEFTQLMKGLQGERLRQGFAYLDSNKDGFITPDQFKRIILELAGHKLSDEVIERLPTLTTLNPGKGISYSEVVAFYNVIRDMDMVERFSSIIREAVAKSSDGRIAASDFLTAASQSTRYALFSPMEASIIFHFASRGAAGASNRLTLIDFAKLLDPRWQAPVAFNRPVDGEGSKGRWTSLAHFARDFGHSVYNFGLGGIAGAFGATMVYPIDLVKTRMQNQRTTVVGELLYKNSLDCVRKVYRNEGFLGFYRGLGPQLIGVAPEKAIKLTMNDLVRGYASDPETGRISLGWELVAGGVAGASQVVFTNPLEIVKIRLQVQGELAKSQGAKPRGAIHIIRSLGLFGLYKGASACLLRDIPFSAIYFPAYNHFKKDLFREGYNGKKLTFWETLAAAAMAGMPAAYFTTPADVIKTRLQVEARKGQSTYNGLVDAGVKIFREEGGRALFKGGVARILRSSPQFGFTLVAYEYLQEWFPYPWQDKPQRLETQYTLAAGEDISRTRARNALKILLDVHHDIGRRGTTPAEQRRSIV
ncbi:mitochondrial carrier [Dacryopinax primogenitus]|uniref:Mitochondrial aspartate-glutamate transporter AGC1 n=1 Tax=Dacryopinax primogenitus (strain DJM 731) TaxID=1858805 RepID=M5G314_DACPD|nr:mitochondrial carrier [Dacryopinax primogenitus]EJU02615.1 mitochondrial carrier [Dacryopinax primogenitus]